MPVPESTQSPLRKKNKVQYDMKILSLNLKEMPVKMFSPAYPPILAPKVPISSQYPSYLITTSLR